LNVKDRSYNQLCWEMDRRKPDWRMRSPSVEGRDNITLLERGPLGPGGAVEAQAPHIEAGSALGQRRFLRREQTGAEGGVCRDRT
jgi:hypothetical protein